MPNNYSASLKVSLAPQHQGLYGQLIRDLYHDPNYSRNLAHNLPFSLESLVKVRVVLIFDSSWLPAAAREPYLTRLVRHLENQSDADYFQDLFQRWSALDHVG